MQEVSEKLNQLPQSSSAVGSAIADIFGGPGEDAGLKYLQTLKDIDTNLSTVKSGAGELGRLQEEQLESQLKLQNALSSLFDMTGGDFEQMTTRAKIFVNDGLVSIIQGIQEAVNWFKELYNGSQNVRAGISAMNDILIYRHKSIWNLFSKKFEELISTLNTDTHFKYKVTSLDYMDCLRVIEENSIVYADPPYSSVHYSRFYHGDLLSWM